VRVGAEGVAVAGVSANGVTVQVVTDEVTPVNSVSGCLVSAAGIPVSVSVGDVKIEIKSCWNIRVYMAITATRRIHKTRTS